MQLNKVRGKWDIHTVQLSLFSVIELIYMDLNKYALFLL